MFSVILPTMWRSQGFDIMCRELKLLDHPLIGEMLIIDNDASKHRIPQHEKVRVLGDGTNKYINPSWNMGAAEAKYDKLCILSDDTIFDPSVFDQMHGLVNEHNGMFGIGSSCPMGTEGCIGLNRVLTFTSASREPCMPQFWRHVGMLMFIHKTGYKPIPEKIRNYYGDTWLWTYNNMTRNKQNKYIEGLDLICLVSPTAGAMDLRHIADADHEARYDVFEEEFGEEFYW